MRQAAPAKETSYGHGAEFPPQLREGSGSIEQNDSDASRLLLRDDAQSFVESRNQITTRAATYQRCAANPLVIYFPCDPVEISLSDEFVEQAIAQQNGFVVCHS